MKHLVNIILIASTLIGCRPDPIDMDVPQAPERIVVASQQAEGNYFVTVLTRSFSALENKEIDLNNPDQPLPEELLVRRAEVYVVLGGERFLLEEVSNGVYATQTLTPSLYNTYTLEIIDHDRGGATCLAQTTMLPKVLLDTFGISPVTGSSNEYLLHYAFTDNPNEQNWYVVNFYTRDNAQDTTTDNPGDVDYIARRLLEQRLDFDLISEKDLRNGKYEITKKFTNNQLDTFGIALSNISKGYYEFLEAQKKYSSVTNKIRGEVINMPTNVSPGYGYFNLHTPDARVIRVER